MENEIQYVSKKTHNRILASMAGWVFFRRVSKWQAKGELTSLIASDQFGSWHSNKTESDYEIIIKLLKDDGADTYVYESFCAGDDHKNGILRVLNTYQTKRN
ncbi:hypothetical protein ACIQXW_23260 [Lysinibacillus sp. NPDC097162]|uniref:hypothetical protein n=1 Tax=Lysinibacillus sp. NPDC097162 TaxID=3364140 RepID=UPI00381751C8